MIGDEQNASMIMETDNRAGPNDSNGSAKSIHFTFKNPVTNESVQFNCCSGSPAAVDK